MYHQDRFHVQDDVAARVAVPVEKRTEGQQALDGVQRAGGDVDAGQIGRQGVVLVGGGVGQG